MMKSALRLAGAGLALCLITVAPALATAPGFGPRPREKDVLLERLGTFETGIFAGGGSEITAFDPATDRLFSINGFTGAVDVVDLTDPTHPQHLFSIDVTPWGAGANHVDVHAGMVVAAVEAVVKQDPGQAVFFATDGDCEFLNAVEVGALPDMVIVTPDGRYALVANEGEPSDDYTIDPEGSVSIIDLSAGVGSATVVTAGFAAWNGREDELRAQGVRIFGPGAGTAQDFEPEYIAVSHDSRTAWVALQENNAWAIVDLGCACVTDIVPMGFKDHLAAGNGFDASDRDDVINIVGHRTLGMYMPDGIASYQVGGRDFIVSANEGDSRDYSGFSEEARVKDLDLDPTAFPAADSLQANAALGRLKTTITLGDTDGDGDHDQIFSYGARSMSIWDDQGRLVSDTGDVLEQVLAVELAEEFNSTNDENGSFDGRSDDKGPEPEGVAVGTLWGRQYAFVGMERIGGIFVFDVTSPKSPRFVQYVNGRDFDGVAADGTAGDLGPEGLRLVSAEDSPTGEPLLLVAHEVSGSVAIYRIVPGDRRGRGHDQVVTDRASPGSSLLQNSPNPFNPMTTISFSLSRETAVRLAVYNLRGELVQTLVHGTQPAGEHQVQWSGANVSSGVYMYMLEADGVRTIKRMTLVK